MKGLQLVAVLSFLIILPACKTQEDIRREKTVENLNEQVNQTQKSTANSNSRFVVLEEEIAKLAGKLEESNHSSKQEIKNAAALKERLANLEATNQKQTEYLKGLNDKLQEQSKYIEQVVASLSSISEQKETKETPKKKRVQKEINQDENNQDESSDQNNAVVVPSVKEAISQYKASEFSSSKEMFQSLLENKKIKKKDKESCLYYLGLIEFKEKNYEDSKAYFSKLFSENQESTYGASTFLYLAKIFIQQKSKEEAGQSLDELIMRYPKSKEAQEGAKLKTKL